MRVHGKGAVERSFAAMTMMFYCFVDETGYKQHSEFKIQRRAEIIHERSELLQVLGQRGQQTRPGHGGVVDHPYRDVVLAAQVVEVREIRREAARRAHQHLAVVEIEAPAER